MESHTMMTRLFTMMTRLFPSGHFASGVRVFKLAASFFVWHKMRFPVVSTWEKWNAQWI